MWESERDPNGRAGGVGGVVAPRYMIEITIDFERDKVPFQPWAAALYKASAQVAANQKHQDSRNARREQ